MKFIAKKKEEKLEVGDVVEILNSRYLVIKTIDSEGLWRLGLVNLDYFDQVPRLYDDEEELMKRFESGTFRIIKSENLELREV